MRRCAALLTPKERNRAFWVGMYSLGSILIDVAGLSMLVPIMVVANDPHILHGDNLLAGVFKATGIESEGNFMILMAATVLVIFLIKNLVTLATGYAQSRFAYDVATSLAKRQYHKYYNLGYTYFKEHNSSDIVNNILNIPIFFAGGVLVSLINFLVEVAGLLLIVVLIAIADYKLFFAVVLTIVPAGYFIYNSTKNRLHKIGTKQIKLGVTTHTKLYQSIFGLVDIRLTNKEHVFLQNYLGEQQHMNDTYKVKHVLNMIPSRALEVFAVLGILVVFIFANVVGEHRAQVFTFLVIFAAAAFRALPSMNRALAAIMGMKSQLSTLDILEDGVLPDHMTRTDVRPMDFEESIVFRDLTFAFEGSDHPAVDGLNFTIQKGERIGIIGESGSGKTTLVNLLLRFLTEQGGGIYVDGKKLEEADVASWRAKVGYVQQNVFLLDATLKENVAFGERPEEIDEKRLKDALEQASLMEFVEGLAQHWDTPVGEMGARLSGGQRQRIGIARALYFQSSVLVFDEATSALDTETENSITDSLQALHQGMTVLVVAHRLTTLRFCDRIMEIKDGKLVHVWSYPELVQEKMLKDPHGNGARHTEA